MHLQFIYILYLSFKYWLLIIFMSAPLLLFYTGGENSTCSTVLNFTICSMSFYFYHTLWSRWEDFTFLFAVASM